MCCNFLNDHGDQVQGRFCEFMIVFICGILLSGFEDVDFYRGYANFGLGQIHQDHT